MSSKKKLSLWLLAWPIMIEMLLQFMIGSADTLMVSRISDDAVAVVGISNQFFQSVIILFMLVTSGAGVLIAQKTGAGNEQDARTIAVMAIKITFIVSTVFSAAIFFSSEWIAGILQIPAPLVPLAVTYLTVVGGGMMITSLILTLNTIIRNTGNTKAPMYIALGMNFIHIALNYLFIFGAMGFPQWGLFGVAISTVVSRTLAVIVLLYIFRSVFSAPIRWSDLKLFNGSLLKDVFRIGWPISINGASWTLSQVVIFSMVASMGAGALATRTYMNTLESFSFLLGWSLAMAVQIQVAQLYGAKRLDEAYQSAWRAMRFGLGVVMTATLMLVLLGEQILRLFTDDKEIIALGISVLLMNLLLQPGKMINMALVSSLNGIGDNRIIMMVGTASMWIIAVGLSYFFGKSLGWGLIGVYAAMVLDEYTRGMFGVYRWRNNKYLKPKQVENARSDTFPA